MKYSSDYETLEHLEKFQQTITSLNRESQQRLDSAKTLRAEADALKAEIQTQQSQTQQLASQLSRDQALIEANLQTITSEKTALTDQIAQAAALKQEIDGIFQQIQNCQTQTSKTQEICSDHLDQSRSNLEKIEHISQTVEQNAIKVDSQYQQFLQHNEAFQLLKTELVLLQDQHTNLALRHKYTSLGLGGGLCISILLAIFL